MLNENTRTVEEQYISAGSSSNLRVEADRMGDADILIAAGWSPCMLGGQLSRLRREWDDSSRPPLCSMTDAKLVMGACKSLSGVLDALTAWAKVKGNPEPARFALTTASYWLSDTCRACRGRGNECIAGTPKLGRSCKKCGGSGKAPIPMGQDGRKAINMLDHCVSRSQSSMKKRLRNSMGRN